MSTHDTTPPRGAHMRLRPGADPWPVIESLAAQLEALTVTVTALAHCFAPLALVPGSGRPTPAGPEKPERRRFGQKDAPPDATGVVPPDPAA